MADLYLVEHHLRRITRAELAMLQSALASACVRLTARGQSVTYLGSTFLPTSERLLSLFEASNADAVRSVTVSSHAPVAGLEVAIALPKH